MDSSRIRTNICCLLFDSFQNWVSILAICASLCNLFEAVIRLTDRNIPAIFSKKVDTIPNHQSRPPLLSLPEVIRPIFSHYWTIDVNLPNLMWSALSHYSYKKQPGYLRQSETEKYLDWITTERGLFCSNRCCVWQWPLCYTTSVYQPSAGCWSRALCYTY